MVRLGETAAMVVVRLVCGEICHVIEALRLPYIGWSVCGPRPMLGAHWMIGLLHRSSRFSSFTDNQTDSSNLVTDKMKSVSNTKQHGKTWTCVWEKFLCYTDTFSARPHRADSYHRHVISLSQILIATHLHIPFCLKIIWLYSLEGRIKLACLYIYICPINRDLLIYY